MIDEKDRRILGELLANSRQSFREISKKLGISVVTVMQHVRKLEKEKVVKGYTALLDYEKLGYDVDVLISVKVSHGKFTEVYSYLRKHDAITAIYDVTGDFDAVIIAKFRNRRALDSFLKKLQAFPYIERTHTVFVLNTLERQAFRVS